MPDAGDGFPLALAWAAAHAAGVRWFGGAAAVKPAKAPSTWDGVVAAGQRLWVTGDGTPCTAAALQKLLEKRTRARFERVINTHLFRDCAATSIATDDPEHVMVAARLLGHAVLRTTERHYVAADTRAALERHHDLIRAIRKPSRALPRAGRQRHT